MPRTGNPRRGASPPGDGGDEGFAGGSGATAPGGGARSGGGMSWGTGGLNFDTKGINDFTEAMKKAADQVERFWKPFQDTSKAKTQTQAFLTSYKTQLKDVQVEAAKLGLGGGGGGGGHPGGGLAHPTLAGNSRMPSTPKTVQQVMRQQGSRFLYGRQGSDETEGFIGRYRLHRQAGDEGIFRSAAAGVASGWANQSGAAKAGEGALALNVVAAAAQRYVTKNMPPAQALQSAANTVAITQSPQSQAWSSRYRNTVAQNLSQQGWGFTGREDIAAAAGIAQRYGISAITTGGPQGRSPMMSSNLQQAGILAGMQGTSAAQQVGVQASLRMPGTVNLMRQIGIQTQPGGKQADQTTIYKQLRDYIFAPLKAQQGRGPNKDEVQMTLRTPGTRAYALVQQMLPDGDAQESFIKWVENSAATGTDVTTVAGAKNAPGAQTTANVIARKGETVEQSKARLDEGMLREQEQAAGVVKKFNELLGTVVDALGPFGSGLQDIVGWMTGAGATAHGLRPGGGGGGGGGGLVGQAIHAGGEYLGVKTALSAGKSVLGRLGGSTAIDLTEAAGGVGAAGAETGAVALGTVALPVAAAAVAGLEVWHSFKQGQKVNKQMDANLRARVVTMDDQALKDEYAMSLATGGSKDSSTKILAEELLSRGIDPKSIPKSDYKPTGGNDNAYIGDPVSRWHWRSADMGDAETTPSGVTADLRGPGRTQGMNAEFVAALSKMFTDNPKLSLTSGFRTQAEQARLYKEKPGLAAPPGKSKHQQGLAADIGPRSEYAWIAQNAGKYGLGLPMPAKEPWHVQPGGAVAGGAVGASEALAAQDAPQEQGLGAQVAAAAGGGISGPDIFGRGEFKPFASGTPALASAVGISSSKSQNTGQSKGGAPTPVNATQTQSEIMASILKVGQSLGADPQMLLAAFETAWAESTMTNLHSGDKDSQGVFQQRPSQGWGTVEQVTNVDYAATSFFKRAAGSKFRGKGTAARMAQDVQRSAFADGSNYQKQRDKAVSSLSGLGVNVTDIGDPVRHGGEVNLNVQGEKGNTTIHIANATFTAQIARGTPEEAENFARQVASILGDRDRLMQIAGAQS